MLFLAVSNRMQVSLWSLFVFVMTTAPWKSHLIPYNQASPLKPSSELAVEGGTILICTAVFNEIGCWCQRREGALCERKSIRALWCHLSEWWTSVSGGLALLCSVFPVHTWIIRILPSKNTPPCTARWTHATSDKCAWWKSTQRNQTRALQYMSFVI